MVGDPGDGIVCALRYGVRVRAERGAWTQRYRLKAAAPSENDFFGWSVATAHGVIAVGTGGGSGLGASGAAYVFR